MRKQELHPRTAVINKTQKNQSKKARNDALAWLMATFPRVFDNTVRIQPLKIGIMHEILAYAEQAAKVGISRSKLREAVVLFTRRIDYLACLKAREMRVDLAGNPDVPVSEEEAEKAAAKIKKRVEKSTRNARKNLSEKVSNHYQFKSTQQPASVSNTEAMPHFLERAPAFNAQSITNPVARTATVIKHKPARQYDPSAVARLKEKLGLSSKRAGTEQELLD